MKKYHVQNYIRWKEDMAAAIKRLPNREDFKQPVEEQLIVEFYSKL